MYRLGLAAAKARAVRVTGVAGAAASLLTAPVPDEGPPILEWILRSIIAIAQIALGWPKGTEVTIADLLLMLFGEDIAAAIEQTLRTITSVPQYWNLLADVFKWAQIGMIFSMFLGIVSYWTVYSSQGSKSATMLDKIWGGRTLIVDPWSWTWKRLLPITAVFVIFLKILQTIVEEGYTILTWLLKFIYEGAGTTAGEAFEASLLSIVNAGKWGFLFFVVILIVLFLFGIRWLFYFVKRLIRFALAQFFVMYEAGQYLDGSRLRKFADPFKKYVGSLLLVLGTIFFIWLAPLLASKFPGIFGAFVLVAVLDIGVDFPRQIEKWFKKGGQKRLRGRLEGIGDWIDQDLEAAQAEAEAAAAEPRHGVVSRLTSWTGSQVSERTPDRVKKLGKYAWNVGKEAAKADPRVAAGLAVVEGVVKTVKDEKAAGKELQRFIASRRGSRSRTSSNPDPRWDRDAVLARTVAERNQLYDLLNVESVDYAVFYELARLYHGQPQVERTDVLTARIQERLQGLSATERQSLAEKGRKVAREARDLRGEQPRPEEL